VADLVAGFLLFILIVVVIVIWASHRARRRKFDAIEKRIGRLERELKRLAGQLSVAPETAAAATTLPRSPVAEAPAREEATPELPPAKQVAEAPTVVTPYEWPAIEPPEVPKPPSPLQIWSERIRAQLAHEEWEAIVGASWLNKIGVLVLVVGIALFLGYSFVRLGPPGRIALGYAVSVAMLIVGVIAEHRLRYRLFARGLIGGGWAAVYFTTYAMHGLEAARVIDSPIVASLALMVVAAGMIGHSLRYRSETVTGLAFVIGFVTLIVSPISGFSLFASIPLVAALLVLAHVFDWRALPLAGLILTYAVYALRFGVLAAGEVEPSMAAFILGQSVLGIYWLLYEGFDLLNLRRRGMQLDARCAIFPLNACGFFGVSLVQWPEAAPHTLYLFFAATAAAYLLSTFIRARLRSPSSFATDASTLDRALFGGYEAGITVAAISALIAIFLGLSGLRESLALLVEGEALFLAGLTLRERYPRVLGGLVLLVAMLTLVEGHMPRADEIALLGLSLHAWVPLALLMVAVFYLNRWLLSAAPLIGEQAYSYVGSALLTAVLGEVPAQYLGVVWLLFAAGLFEFGLRRNLTEFRFQCYGVAAFALLALAAINAFGAVTQASRPWLFLGVAALIAYGVAWRVLRLQPDRLPALERGWLQTVSSAAGTVWLASFAWYALPSPVVAIAWGALGLGLIEVGALVALPTLRLQGHIVVALALGRLFLANFTNFGVTAGVSHRLLTVLPLIALCYYLWATLSRISASARWEQKLPPLYLYAGAVLAAVLIRFELGRVTTVLGWALLALALLYFGVRWANRDLRFQSYVLAILTFARSWSTNFYIPASLAGAFGRVTTGAIVVVSFYAAQFLSPRLRPAAAIEGSALHRALLRFDAHGRAVFSILATVLLTVLLFYEVSGHLLTVAWGLEGVALLLAGFALHERVLRLSGLALLLVCISKLFIYDLRALETIYRILSFAVLGLLLIGVSWVYTRYRDTLKQYL